MGLKMKKWLTNFQFQLQEARAPRQLLSLELDSTGTEIFLGYLVDTYSKLDSLYTYV